MFASWNANIPERRIATSLVLCDSIVIDYRMRSFVSLRCFALAWQAGAKIATECRNIVNDFLLCRLLVYFAIAYKLKTLYMDCRSVFVPFVTPAPHQHK